MYLRLSQVHTKIIEIGNGRLEVLGKKTITRKVEHKWPPVTHLEFFFAENCRASMFHVV